MNDEEKEVYRKFYDNLTLCESFWDIKEYVMDIRDAFVLRRIIEKFQKANSKMFELFIETKKGEKIQKYFRIPSMSIIVVKEKDLGEEIYKIEDDDKLCINSKMYKRYNISRIA